jgi:hypothetical protein
MGRPIAHLLGFLGAALAVLVLAAALNFVVDPLQLFRTARLYAPMYSNDARMQDAGLIHSQTFDTVLMGTSLAIHFLQSDIDRVLGVHSLKLSMPGSNSHEQSFVLAAALDRHPQRVIWEIDDWIFGDAPDIDHDAFLPADYYRMNVKGIAQYLFSGAMARESLWMLVHAAVPPTLDGWFKFSVRDVGDINALAPDFNVAAAYNADKARAEFADLISPERRGYLAQGYDYDAMVRNFEHDAVALIEKNPGTLFDVYFPPYSILQWIVMRDASPSTLGIVYDFTGYVSRRLAQLPNARLHDFRAIEDITHDLGNYADVIHHSPAIDLKVLSMLASDRYLVDRAVPTASLERLKAQVGAYQVGK